VGVSNVQGLDPATGIITFNQTGTYEYEFESSNGGASVSVFDLNRNRDPLYLPSVQSFDGSEANISLSTTNTLIVSNAAISGSLLVSATVGNTSPVTAAEGQIKTLIYGNSTVGNCLVTVENAGWQASGNGTANLSAVGSAATFQYLDGRWFCIGNNGVTFT
jgi:hypothetical protein